MTSIEEFCKKEALELLLQILSIPSVNGLDDEGKVAVYICDYLRKSGIEAEVQKIDEKHSNVIAKIQGKESGKSIIWNGHLDTVPCGNIDEWSTNPMQPFQCDGSIYARGASDMKSGLAAMVYALCEIKKRNDIPQNTIYFIGTCDEEKGGLGAVEILNNYDFLKDAELLLIGEPTGCQLGVAQKGCMWIELLIEGKTSHGAYPEEGLNAVESGLYIFNKLKSYITSFSHGILGESTAQITGIEGGIANNMTPDKCKLTLDIRVAPSLTLSMIEKEIESIVAEFNKNRILKISYKCKVLNYRRAIEISHENLWLQTFRDRLLSSENNVKYIGINYFTDASILTKNMTSLPVILFGPGDANLAHKPNESVEIEKYYKSINTLLKIF